MKKVISLVIIAHNEEEYLFECLKNAIAHQTLRPSEVIVLVHNSTDKTLEIANYYHANGVTGIDCRVIEYNGNAGIPYARIEAFKYVSPNADIVLCLDGDSIPAKNWIQVMSNILKHERTSLVGSLVKFRGPLFACKCFNIFHTIKTTSYRSDSIHGVEAMQWVWGSSFGFHRKIMGSIIEYLRVSIQLQKQLELASCMEHYIRAYYLFINNSSARSVVVTNKTFVKTNVKERTAIELLRRAHRNLADKSKLDRYFFSF